MGRPTPSTGRVDQRSSARLDDRVALVLGASLGIGAQIARTLAARGAMAVAACPHSERDLHALTQEITNNGGHCLVAVTDASTHQRHQSINLLMEQTFDTTSALDVAVNNAATNHPPTLLAEVSLEDFDNLIDLNLRGLFVALRRRRSSSPATSVIATYNARSTRGLNLIESWNRVNTVFFFGKSGEFATNRRDQQQLGMLALHILQAALVYINTLMIQDILAEPEWDDVLTPEDKRGLTALFWAHVRPYGEITLNMTTRLAISQAPPTDSDDETV